MRLNEVEIVKIYQKPVLFWPCVFYSEIIYTKLKYCLPSSLGDILR